MDRATDPSWTLGTLVAFPLGVLTTLALVVVAILLLQRRSYDAVVGGILVAVLAVAAAVVTGFAMWPWQAEYHRWTPVAGTVEEINERFFGSGGNISQRFVVTIDGQPYGCDDTRCANLDVGDDVSLLCKPEWEYAAVDGYECRWNLPPETSAG